MGVLLSNNTKEETNMRITKCPPVERPFCTLELTEYEAMVLQSITEYIGGSPEGPRGVFTKLRSEFRSIGLVCLGYYPMEGNVYFK